jgi:hypothetical protein
MAGKKVVERDKGKTDTAAAAASLAVGGMDFEAGTGFEAKEGRCGSSAPAICAM